MYVILTVASTMKKKKETYILIMDNISSLATFTKPFFNNIL